MGDDHYQKLLDDKPQDDGKVVLKTENISFKEALVASSKIAGFAVLGTLFHPMYSIVNNIVLGHSGDANALAGLGLGALTIGITALSIGICFAFGAATFMTQEYGRGDFRAIQVYMNRSLFLNVIVFIILYIPSCFIGKIYAALGQDEKIAAYGTEYVHTIMPFLFLELCNWSYLQFATSQRKMQVQPLSIISGAAMHASLVGILYFWLDMGFTGICWATSGVFVGRMIATQIYVRTNKELQWFDDVHLFSKETVSNLSPMVKVCTMSMFMGIWGWWAFDIFTFMATYLGSNQAAAQSQLRSLGLLTFMLPVGYSSATGILAGNEMGNFNPVKVMTYYKVCMFMASIITVVQMSLLWIFRDNLIKMYTNIPEVAAFMVAAWPVLILFTFFDTTQAMGMSVIRASGKQSLGAIITGIAYFVIGVPISYWFAFSKDMEIKGLWWGPTMAVAFNTICYNVIIYFMDWESIMQGIYDRKIKEEQLKAEAKEKAGDDFTKVED